LFDECLQKAADREAFFHLLIYLQLLQFVPTVDIEAERSTRHGRSDLVLHYLRQVHEFKLLLPDPSAKKLAVIDFLAYASFFEFLSNCINVVIGNQMFQVHSLSYCP
jgi:hypothetical protein